MPGKITRGSTSTPRWRRSPPVSWRRRSPVFVSASSRISTSPRGWSARRLTPRRSGIPDPRRGRTPPWNTLNASASIGRARMRRCVSCRASGAIRWSGVSSRISSACREPWSARRMSGRGTSCWMSACAIPTGAELTRPRPRYSTGFAAVTWQGRLSRRCWTHSTWRRRTRSKALSSTGSFSISSRARQAVRPAAAPSLSCRASSW